MKKHKVKIFAAVLVVLTIAAAMLHLNIRDAAAEGSLQMIVRDQSISLDISKFDYQQVSGIRMNGKGEEIPVEGLGVAIKDVLTQAKVNEYELVRVISDDSYSAEISAEEVADSTKAYLLLDEENELRLVVFGDTNSKRSVSNVVQIVVE